MTDPARPRASEEFARPRWIAVLVLSLLAGIGMLAYPLLPVIEHTATYRWDGSGPTALPLSPYRPAQLTVTAPCEAQGVFLSTVRATDEGMQEGSGTLTRAREVLALSLHGERHLHPLGACDALTVDITTESVTVTEDGVVTLEWDGDHRPAIDSLSSGPDVTGVSAVVVADTQFNSSPTTSKIVLGATSLALLAIALALALLIDRPRRSLSDLRLRLGPEDGVVVGAIVVGVIAGGATDDDGFIAQIIRTPAMSGYVGNYVRWNNSPEAPFGWFYDIYARWGQISMEPVWLRILPALLGLAAWLVLRHGLAPRLLRTPTVPARIALTAGFTLLWLVFANSLRPEIYFALGSGIVVLCVLDALHRRAVWPLLLGAVVAGLAVGAGPTGLVAVAPFVIAAPRLWRWLARTPVRGLAVATAWLAALGSVVLLMFADQTLASILSANHARTEFGPIYPFWEDYQRYWKLWWSFAARQFSVYLSVVALAYLALRWRKPGGVAGLNRMVSAQILGVAIALVIVMLLGPTKLPHHFGALLLLGPLAMAAGAQLLEIATRRYAAGFLVGGSVVAVGLALHYPNTWWKLSTLGLLLDKNPLAVGPIPLWPFVVVAGLVLGWWITRRVAAGKHAYPHPGRTALAYALALVVLSGWQYANFVQAAVVRGPERYTVASAALSAMTGCKLERSLHYEPDPAAGVLPRESPEPFTGEAIEGLRAWHADAQAPDGFTTDWYALPGDVRTGQWPLVVAASGVDEAHRVIVEYDNGVRRELTPTRKTLGVSDLSDIRLHPAAEVTRFRLIAESDGPASLTHTPKEWEADGAERIVPFVVAEPRVPVTQPLLNLTEDATVAVAWNLAFFAPCLDTPRQADGRVEIADYILSDSEQPGNMSYHSRSGGPFAGVLGLTVPSRVPVYAAGDYTESEMSALDLVRLVPVGVDIDGRGITVDLQSRVRGGLAAVPVIP